MSTNDGFINELDMVKAINGKSYIDLNPNLQTFCQDIFESNLDTTKLFAEKIKGNSKPDIMITCKNTTKYISIKKGGGNSVHQEKLDVFISFLKSIGISKKSIDTLLLFHYGDDTTNDTGKIRYTAKECEKRYEADIAFLNRELNNGDTLIKLLDRVLFVGNVEDGQMVDYIYHGTKTKGYWASRNELYKYFTRNKFDSKSIHIGSLIYQVWGRDEKRTAIHPERRYVIQFKWSQILSDFEKIKGDR